MQKQKTVECKAVVFDLFGTLIGHYSRAANEQFLTDLATLCDVPRSTLVDAWVATRPAAMAGDFDSTEDDMKHLLGRLLCGPVAPSLVDAAVDLTLDLVRGFLRPRSTTLTTLSYLQRQGFLLGLISGCGPEMPELWPHCAISEYIRNPVFSCEVGFNKPDKRIYEACRNQLDVAPVECLYVGDGSCGELSAARRYGMSAVLLRTELDDVYDSVREDVQEWDGMVIDDLIELEEIIRQPN